MSSAFQKYKKGLLIGFLFGSFFAPLLTFFVSMTLSYGDIIRPILMTPFDFVAHFIPDVQIEPNTFRVPAYKWTATLGFNGICFALLGALIQRLFSSKKKR